MEDSMMMPPEAPNPDALLADAEAGGKLEPLKAYFQEEGLSEDPKEILKLAQEDDRTRGKSPEELVSMLKADDALMGDLLAYKDGGELKRGMPKKAEPPMSDALPPEDEGSSEEEMPKKSSPKKGFGLY